MNKAEQVAKFDETIARLQAALDDNPEDKAVADAIESLKADRAALSAPKAVRGTGEAGS